MRRFPLIKLFFFLYFIPTGVFGFFSKTVYDREGESNFGLGNRNNIREII